MCDRRAVKVCFFLLPSELKRLDAATWDRAAFARRAVMALVARWERGAPKRRRAEVREDIAMGQGR